MTITPEEIIAYVDGELEEGARNRITLAALVDIDLAERIAAERALRRQLQAHYAPLAEDIRTAYLFRVERSRGITRSKFANEDERKIYEKVWAE